MTRSLRNWWRARSLREQRLLAAMLALAAIVFVWIGVIRPLGDARAEARDWHAQTLVAVAQIEAEAARLAAIERPDAPGAPIDRLRSELDALALDASRIEPEQGGLRVDLPMIGSNALFSLVDRLAARGLGVDTLAARPEPGGALVVTMRLRPIGDAR